MAKIPEIPQTLKTPNGVVILDATASKQVQMLKAALCAIESFSQIFISF